MPTPRITPSMAVSLTALVLAVSGGAYAATVSHVAKKSTHRAAAKGLTKAQVIALVKGQLNARHAGPGPAGAAGAMGATGDRGLTGPAGPVTSALPAGVTLRGTFVVSGNATAFGQSADQAISWGFSLAEAPTVHYVNYGAAVPAACAGGTAVAPRADPGNLCLFESNPPFNSTLRSEYDPTVTNDLANQATPYGAAVYAISAAAGGFIVRGSWAVTGP
jgi:hypothetical protein